MSKAFRSFSFRALRAAAPVWFLLPLSGQNAAPADAAQKEAVREGDASAYVLDPLLKQFINVLGAVQKDAAEPVTLDKSIYEGAIPSMLRPLDPHTQFFDPQQFEQLKQMENSEQKGFGSVSASFPAGCSFCKRCLALHRIKLELCQATNWSPSATS